MDFEGDKIQPIRVPITAHIWRARLEVTKMLRFEPVDITKGSEEQSHISPSVPLL